jgi:hypothetical protein
MASNKISIYFFSLQTGNTWSNNHEERTTKKRKKGKEGTSKLLEESAITETGTKLEGLCGSSNALVCKLLVPPDRKKLLVLDINGLLADFVYPDDKHQSADFKISGKLGNNYYSLSLENNCTKSCNSKYWMVIFCFVCQFSEGPSVLIFLNFVLQTSKSEFGHQECSEFS